MNRYVKFGLPTVAILGTLGWLAFSSTIETPLYFKTIPEVKQMGDQARGLGGCASFRISTFRFSRVRLCASCNRRVFSCRLALPYSSRTRSRYCSRECISILGPFGPFLVSRHGLLRLLFHLTQPILSR